jgi:hypothetical protein
MLLRGWEALPKRVVERARGSPPRVKRWGPDGGAGFVS